MSITLWGRPNSANVQKALWALGELELPFEHIPMAVRGVATARPPISP